MTLTFTVVGFSFVFENENLVCFAVFNNFSNNFCTFNYGLANLNISIIYNGQNFFKNYFSANFCVQFFNLQSFAFAYAVLFATGFDNCVHLLHLP